MARVQGRRTVSLSRELLKRLKVFASSEGTAVSALAEFALEQLLETGLNAAAFDAWYAARMERVLALQRAAGAATSGRQQRLEEP